MDTDLTIHAYFIHIPLFFWKLAIKAIAKAQSGDNVLAIATDFLAQACDVDINGSIQHIDLIFPDMGEDLFPWKDIPTVLQQQSKDLELLLGERNLLAVNGRPDASSV